MFPNDLGLFYAGSGNLNIYFSDSSPDGYASQVRLVRSGQSFNLLNVLRPSSDYVDHADGTVTHTPTGLMWQKCSVGQIWSVNTCTGTANAYTWNAAKLLKSNFAAQTDWRLPTEEELLSLVDYSTSPKINTSVFPNTNASNFWSASANAGNSSSAWYVYFNYGNAYYGNFKSNAFQVRLVRAGQSFGPFVLGVSTTGTGQVSSSQWPIYSCGVLLCSGGYNTGDLVTLTASPSINLISWGGACANAGSAATCTVTMDAAKTVTASFKDTPLVSGLTATLTFASQNIASTSPAQTVTLSNTGTAALNITSINTTTGDFVTTNTCGAGTGAGGSCTLNVSFKPTAGGPRTGTLTLTTDATDSPHSITLTGSGQGALAKLSATSKTFASQNQGTTSVMQTLTVTNSGGAVLNISSITATGDFTQTTTCGATLVPTVSCNISISFAPTSVGAMTGSIVITSDSPNSPQTVSLSGTGLAVPVVSLGASALSFAVVSVGSSAVQTVKLSNTGAAVLNLSSITASGDFSQTNNCGTGLGAGGFCNVSVTFTPSASGLRSGAITLTSNAAGSPHSVSLTGGNASTQTISFITGWNLVGNGTNAPINMATSFADANQFVTIWKWIAAQTAWSFYAPALAAQGATVLADYAASKGYQVLTNIAGGEGFWVNAKQPASVSVTQGQVINVAQAGATLTQGWNLVSIGDPTMPKQFCDAQNTAVTTLWAWDAAKSAWYFYAPALDASGGLGTYVLSKGYPDFATSNKSLGLGVGFWVNKP